MTEHVDHMDYLKAAADAVTRQACEEVPGIGIPIDPDVADFMGVFAETALSPEDLDDDHLLTVNQQGVSFYDE